MIAPKPLHAELTQPLQRDLPGQRASSEESRREPLTRTLTRSLPPTPAWLEQGVGSDDDDDE